MPVNPAGWMQPLLSGATALNTVSGPVNCLGSILLKVYVVGSGTVSGGVITLEETSYDPDKDPIPATWASLGTVTASGATAGATVVQLLPTTGGFTPFHYVRARISTAITGGGSVTVRLIGA